MTLERSACMWAIFLCTFTTAMASTLTAASRILVEPTRSEPSTAIDPFQMPLRRPHQPVQDWPHRSVLLQPGVGTRVSEPNVLPIGVPIDFETDLFRGQFLLRLRNVTSDHPSASRYFDGSRRVMQTVLQGRFKKNVNMADLYVGCIFRQPMKLVPPPLVHRVLQACLGRIAPGAILDFAAPQPRIITLYAGKAQTLNIARPGSEPNIMARELPDHGWQRAAAGDRQRLLSRPSHAAQYEFDTEHVYTMEIYDEAMDYGNYEIQIPMYGKFPLGAAIGAQPMSFTAVTRQGEVLYDFALWHESIVAPQQGAGVNM